MPMGQLLLVVVLTSLLIVGVILGPLVHYLQQHRKRRLEPEGQLTAVELGRTLPGQGYQQPWFTPVLGGIIIGAGVPFGAFVSAMISTVSVGFHEPVWIATGVVGLGAAICGSLLAGLAYGQSHQSAADGAVKPLVEEDAYDVVGARG
jgi:hypothetical protein